MSSFATSSQRPRILAIDDTPANLMVLAKSLASQFDVQLAVSGAAGLSLARTSRPDLILLDVMMPEMDGYETCRQLKADPTLSDIPVIFVTALADQGAEARGLALGALDYLSKPFNVDIARQRITNLIERQCYLRALQAQRDQLELRVAERTREIQRHQADLAILKDMAERSCATKGKLLRAMGGELQTPMQAIVALVGTLRQQLDDPVALDCLAAIDEAANHLLTQSADLLRHVDAGRTLSPAQDDFSLRDLEAALQAEYLPLFRLCGRQLRLEVDPGPDPVPHFRADRTRLLQLIGNLIANVLALARAGEVRVRLAVDRQASGGGCLQCDVIDPAAGSGTATLADLLEPAGDPAAVPDRTLETGVGLPMCRELALALGGTLVAEREAGRRHALCLRVPVEYLADATVGSFL